MIVEVEVEIDLNEYFFDNPQELRQFAINKGKEIVLQKAEIRFNNWNSRGIQVNRKQKNEQLTSNINVIDVVEIENEPKIYRIKLKAEVEYQLNLSNNRQNTESLTKAEDPNNEPLRVVAWTEKESYQFGEKVKLFLWGNKDFFAQIYYQDASGNQLQLLPNQFRSKNYFVGGQIIEFPSEIDDFELEVNPPFGEEIFTVLASSGQFTQVPAKKDDAPVPPIAQVQAEKDDKLPSPEKHTSVKVRGIKINPKNQAEDFVEYNLVITTLSK